PPVAPKLPAKQDAGTVMVSAAGPEVWSGAATGPLDWPGVGPGLGRSIDGSSEGGGVAALPRSPVEALQADSRSAAAMMERRRFIRWASLARSAPERRPIR